MISIKFERKGETQLAKEDGDPDMILIEFKRKIKSKLAKKMMIKF